MEEEKTMMMASKKERKKIVISGGGGIGGVIIWGGALIAVSVITAFKIKANHGNKRRAIDKKKEDVKEEESFDDELKEGENNNGNNRNSFDKDDVRDGLRSLIQIQSSDESPEMGKSTKISDNKLEPALETQCGAYEGEIIASDDLKPKKRVSLYDNYSVLVQDLPFEGSNKSANDVDMQKADTIALETQDQVSDMGNEDKSNLEYEDQRKPLEEEEDEEDEEEEEYEEESLMDKEEEEEEEEEEERESSEGTGDSSMDSTAEAVWPAESIEEFNTVKPKLSSQNSKEKTEEIEESEDETEDEDENASDMVTTGADYRQDDYEFHRRKWRRNPKSDHLRNAKTKLHIWFYILLIALLFLYVWGDSTVYFVSHFFSDYVMSS